MVTKTQKQFREEMRKFEKKKNQVGYTETPISYIYPDEMPFYYQPKKGIPWFLKVIFIIIMFLCLIML